MFKARASRANDLLVGLKVDGKQFARMKELPNPIEVGALELGQTAKTYIEDQWLFDNYHYDTPMYSKYVMKGILCEQDARDFLTEHYTKDFRKRNTERYENQWFTGTPDVILDDVVEDIKCKWDIKTFSKSEVTPLYYTQLQVYMNLLGLDKARLCCVLLDTPEHLVRGEKQTVWYQLNIDDKNLDAEYDMAAAQIMINHKFNHIEPKKRIKIFDVDYNNNHVELLKLAVEEGDKYYKTLKL